METRSTGGSEEGSVHQLVPSPATSERSPLLTSLPTVEGDEKRATGTDKIEAPHKARKGEGRKTTVLNKPRSNSGSPESYQVKSEWGRNQSQIIVVSSAQVALSSHMAVNDYLRNSILSLEIRKRYWRNNYIGRIFFFSWIKYPAEVIFIKGTRESYYFKYHARNSGNYYFRMHLVTG